MNKPEAISRLRNICSKAEKCKYDVRLKLIQWNYSEDGENLINELENEGFINEKRYASSFASDKMKFSKWGKIKIQFYLKKKNIDEQHIESAIKQIDNKEYLETILSEIKKKSKSLLPSDNFSKKRKLLAFAYQRGYENDIANQIIEKILG